MMASQNGKQRQLLLFRLAKEFAEVFESRQFKPVRLTQLTQAYQSRHRKNFSPRLLEFGNLDRFVDELPIFSKGGDGAKTTVTLNRLALLEFFFRPVLEKHGGSVSTKDIAKKFESFTGVSLESICGALLLSNVEDLIYVLENHSKLFKTKVARKSGETILCLNPGHSHGKRGNTQEAAPSPIQQIPNRDNIRHSDSPSEYPGSGNKTLLPTPAHVSGPAMHPPREQLPNVDPHSFSQSPTDGRGLNSPLHPLPPVGIPMGVRHGPPPPSLNSPLHPLSPVGIPMGVRHGPPSPSPNSPLHPLPSVGIPMGIRHGPPSPSPSYRPPFLPRSPQHPAEYYTPQVIGTNFPPGARQPPTPPLQPHPFSDKFPHPNIEPWRETILPSHSAFRPDLQVPDLPPGATQFPKSKKKGGALEPKQKVIDKINAKVEELISELSSKGKFLQPDTVRTLLLEMMKKENQSRSYSDRVYQKDITAMAKYSKVHGRVDELIKVFCWSCPVTSLYELEQALIESEKVESYEALQLGPIIKHPRVIDLFKLQEAATLDTVPDLSAYKIHNYLMKFMNKAKRRDSKYSVEDFLEYVREKEFAESVYHLCIRITSFPLALQTNFRFRTSQSQARRRMETAMEDEMKIVLQHETEKLRKKLSGSHADDPLSIRRELAGKGPIQILSSIFNACNNYFIGPHLAKVGAFMQMVTEKAALRHLFLLAIYEGAYGAEKLMPKLMEDHHPTQAPSSSSQHCVFFQPQGEVLQELLSQLRRTRFPVDLGSLARVEEMTVEKFGAPNFDSLGNGSFLTFVASHDKACEALGGRLIGTNSSASHIGCVKTKVMNIIRQLNFDKRDDQDAVSACVTSQFGVDTFEDLSCGSVHKIISESQDSHQAFHAAAVTYLSPLLLNGGICLQESKQSVGILGHQSKEDALSCLRSTPLLEDLKQWSHWELIFQPQHGQLEEFLQSELSCDPASAVHALEISPGQLLRIDPNSSVTDFVTALNRDSPDPIEVAGNIVSLIVKRGSTKNISIQLLARHVTTCLEKMVASHETSDIASKFVYHTLIRIPFKLCKLIVSELFIDPLRRVTSTTTVDGLVSLCTTREHRRLLQALGMAVGIKSWVDDFNKMITEAHEFSRLSANLVENITESSSTFPDFSSNLFASTPSELAKTSLDDDQEEIEVFEIDTDDSANLSTQVLPQTSEEMEEKESRCKAVVQAIRHDEFGIGVDLDPQQQLVAEKQREREGRGIKRLSLELYSKDTHFVLELIQNADDNDYSHHRRGRDDEEVPSLKFVINSHAITVLNNEVGFSEKNIRAICDVGKSTKGAHRSGYIGQKGIGFKSVFRVTDRPEIHSNGFHVGFDASADPIGFILPHWIDNYQLDKESMWRTKIILSLKESHLSSNMAKKFNDIQPSLLLFLHRLRSISVQDEVTGQERHMLRKDRQRGVVDIKHTNGAIQSTDRWLVVKKRLDKASEFKPDVEMTELALAFPVTTHLNTIMLAKELQQQQVFAFLPLRSYGFRFILQGDFDLPSSREDVNSDSPWNQWLREEIPLLFVEALTKMKELPSVPEMRAVAQFLQFVPLEGELHDFFQPVTSQILNLIKGTNCLPSDPCSSSDSSDFTELVKPASEHGFNMKELQWKQPSQLLFVKEKFSFIREHISQALLMSSLSLSYLNSVLLPFINPALQYQLGMCSITVDHLVEIAQAVVKLYTQSPDLSSDCSDFADSDCEEDEDIICQTIKVSRHSKKHFIRWVANWLACVHMVMEDSNDMGTETIEKLKRFAVLPLEGGMMATTSQSSLFFPPDDTAGERESKSSNREFKAIFKEMSVLETALFEEGEALVQSRIRKVLELIGVRNLYPVDIIKHHILPQFTSGSWKTKKMDLLCNYLVYIKDCSEQPGYGIKEAEVIHLLKDSVVLITNQGPKLPSKETIHFSSSYLPDPDFENLFPDVKWTVVKSDYLKKSKNKEARLSWVRLLIKLGVKTGIAVQRISVSIPEDSTEMNKLHESHWSRLPTGGLTLRDWQSDEIEQIVKSVANKPTHCQRSQMKNLAELLDQNWEAEYKRYLDAQIYDERNENFLDATTSSSFHQFLLKQAWLPPDGVYTDISKPLYSGRELFDTSSRQIRCLLHTHVPYIGAKLKNEDFVNRLCIKRTVKIEELINYLLKWTEQSSEDGAAPFYTSIEHMSHVYVYLKQESEGECFTSASESMSNDTMHLIEKFREEKLVFVPDRYQDNSTRENIAGHFQTIHTVCWNDPSTVLYMRQKHSLPLSSSLPKVLSLYYRTQEGQATNNQLKQAFLYFGVPEAPRVASFITLLKYISTLSPHPEPEHVKDFTSVAFELVRLCKEGTSNVSQEFVYNNLKNAKVFPTTNRVWVSLQDCLVEDDDKNIAKCFQTDNSQLKVFFILWPDIISKSSKTVHKQQVTANQETKEEFLKICQISKLSAKVSPRVDFKGDARPIDKIKAQLSSWVPLIQRFIASNCEDLYSELIQDGIQDKLYRLQVLSVMSLSCRYFINHNGSPIASPGSIEKGCEYCFDDNTSTIYVAADKIEKPRALHTALMKLFAQTASEADQRTFNSFLAQLLLDCPTTKNELEDLELDCDLRDLPDDEVLWEVPLPKYQACKDEEQTTSDDESDQQSSEEEETDTQSKDIEIPEESKRLTSWPPRAAVDPSACPPRHAKQISDSTKDKSLSHDLSASMIGEEEVEAARLKHLQDYVEPGKSVQGVPFQHGVSQGISEGHSYYNNSPPNSVSTDTEKSTLPHGNSQAHTVTTSNMTKTVIEHSQKHMQLKDSNLQEENVSDETVSSTLQDQDQSNKRSSSDIRYPRDSTWKPVKRAEVVSEINLVDIQYIVQNIQDGGSTPLIELLDDTPSEDEESLLKIGRWGELYVYTILKKKGHLPDGSQIKSIRWINEQLETDKPYDIVVEVQPEISSQESQDRSVYIEVKSTAANNKELVSISLNQLEFAEDHGEDFHLYRVYSAGSLHSRLCMLENLYCYIKGHHIRFFFEL